MKYMVEDDYGQIYPVINLIDKEDNETDDILKAVSMVVQAPDGGLIPVSEECTIVVYRVH